MSYTQKRFPHSLRTTATTKREKKHRQHHSERNFGKCRCVCSIVFISNIGNLDKIVRNISNKIGIIFLVIYFTKKSLQVTTIMKCLMDELYRSLGTVFTCLASIDLSNCLLLRSNIKLVSIISIVIYLSIYLVYIYIYSYFIRAYNFIFIMSIIFTLRSHFYIWISFLQCFL